MSKSLLITVVLVLALLVVGALFYFRVFQKTEEPQTFGELLFEKVPNPTGDFPKTNPFEVKTNPFE